MQVQFGRYTDALKTDLQRQQWSEAEKHFAAGDYLPAYLAFFEYLRDPEADNVEFEATDGRVDFRLYQGSKRLVGYADAEKVEFEGGVATMEKPSVVVMRKLLEINYALSYSRFALNGDRICIRFDAPVAGGQPRKLYYALREAAINADYYDDPLVHEFSALKPVDESKVRQLEATELAAKMEFLPRWIAETLRDAATLHPDKQAGAISWMYLCLVYRIDYLIAPQGELMNDLRKQIQTYHVDDGKSFPEKNYQMKLAFERIAGMGEALARDLYAVTSTFATTQNAGVARFGTTLADVFNGYNVWKNPEQPAAGLACLEYAAAQAFHGCNLPKPVAGLLHLFMQILHPDYFAALGSDERYRTESGELDQEAITLRVDAIVLVGQGTLPALMFRSGMLRFGSLLDFAQSFMTEAQAMVAELVK
ncbi:MAG: hypothetical protein ABIR47_04915 [Candidatus Kapaibacterium sp.]